MVQQTLATWVQPLQPTTEGESPFQKVVLLDTGPYNLTAQSGEVRLPPSPALGEACKSRCISPGKTVNSSDGLLPGNVSWINPCLPNSLLVVVFITATETLAKTPRKPQEPLFPLSTALSPNPRPPLRSWFLQSLQVKSSHLKIQSQEPQVSENMKKVRLSVPGLPHSIQSFPVSFIYLPSTWSHFLYTWIVFHGVYGPRFHCPFIYDASVS